MRRKIWVQIKLTFWSSLCCIMLSCEQNQLKYDAAGKAYREIYSTTTGITERIDYYPDGKVKARGFFKEGKEHGEFVHYDEIGNLEEISVYRDGVLDGILSIYYPNGKLKEETCYSKGMPIGWSYKYRENGEKQAAYQYIRFEDRYKGNQRIRYNEVGAVVADSSHYMTVSSNRDTISLGEELTFRFKLEAPFYGSKSRVRLLVGGFDEKYRHVDPAATDTINGNGLTAEFVVLPKKKGKHVVRGRLEDYKVEPISTKELMDRYSIKSENPDEVVYKTETVSIYFTKSFYVK